MCALQQAEYKRLKTRLTTKKNKLSKVLAEVHKISGCPTCLSADKRAQVVAAAREVINEATSALAIFERKGSPDSWSTWENAKDDAIMTIRRHGGTA